MSQKSLFVFAVLVVALGYAGPAQAERLYGNYRGPEDAKAADTSQDQNTATGSGEIDAGGPSGGDSSDGSGGIGDGGGGSDGGGGGDDSGGGGDDSGGGGEDSGSDIGGGSSGSDGSSAGGAEDSGSGLSTGGSSGGGRGKRSAASRTEKFELVSWFFEHNREEFVYRVAAERNRRIQLPFGTTAAVFTRLPRDERVRSPVTPEDRERIFDILKTATIDKDSVVRDAAVIALGKLGTPQAVAVLLERLRLESAKDVKQDTILALGLTRSPDVIEPLITHVKVRGMTPFALMALGISGDKERAGPVLVEFFEKHVRRGKSVEDLACTAVALGALDYEPAVPLLAKSLKQKKLKDLVKVYICEALGRIGGDAAKSALLKAAGAKGVEVPRAAVLALGGIPDADVLKFLTGKDGMKGNSNSLLSGFAAIAAGTIMEQLPESEWRKTPAMIREIASSPNKNKIKAQYANLALALFGGFDAEMRRFYVESLSGASIDPNTLSSMAMAAGVGGLTDMEPMLAEIAGSVSRDPKLGSYAAMALGMIGSGGPKRVTQLRKIYADIERPDVRRGAVLSLGLVGDRSDVGFLLTVIKETEDKWIARYTRGSAVAALGLIGDGESVARIQELLSDRDPRTRAFAVTALGFLADKDQVPRLATLFGRNNFRVEFPAIKAVMGQL